MSKREREPLSSKELLRSPHLYGVILHLHNKFETEKRTYINTFTLKLPIVSGRMK